MDGGGGGGGEIETWSLVEAKQRQRKQQRNCRPSYKLHIERGVCFFPKGVCVRVVVVDGMAVVRVRLRVRVLVGPRQTAFVWLA